MENKKLFILLLCVILTCPAFAFKSRTSESVDSWTQEVATTSRGGVMNDTDLDNMKEDPNVPVGNMSWLLVLGLGLTYGISIFVKKRKEIRE